LKQARNDAGEIPASMEMYDPAQSAHKCDHQVLMYASKKKQAHKKHRKSLNTFKQ
jgi:hypothetical protein